MEITRTKVGALSSSPQTYSTFMIGLWRVETYSHKALVPSVAVIYTEDRLRQTLPGISGQTINRWSVCTERLAVRNILLITCFLKTLFKTLSQSLSGNKCRYSQLSTALKMDCHTNFWRHGNFLFLLLSSDSWFSNSNDLIILYFRYHFVSVELVHFRWVHSN